MRLRHLRVRNIRSYVSGAVDFPDGTTLVAGDVGAGKTSLLYAIEMALFGTSEVDAAFLVRHGAGHAEVHVAFDDEAHRYEIGRRFRRVRRKGKESYEPEAISFSVDGAKTEYSATELRQRVIELLGFADNPSPQAHSDLWRWAVYVPQERMRDILAARPQDRLETVRKALGVEQFRSAAENAQDVAAELRRSATARRSEADRLKHHDDEFASWTEESDRRRMERVALESERARREAALVEARAAAERADAAVRRLDVDRRELESLRAEDASDRAAEAERERARADRAREIERLGREIVQSQTAAADLAGLRRGIAEADESLARLRARAEANGADVRRLIVARSEGTAAEARAKDADSVRERSARELSDARAALEERLRSGPMHEPPAPTPDSLDAIDARLAESRQHEQDRAADLTRAQSVHHDFVELLSAGVCPRCGQPVRPSDFEPHRAESERSEAEAARAHASAVSDRERIEEERRARERYERAHDRWREKERERTEARAALARADASHRAAEAAAATARLELEAARSRAGEIAGAEATEAEIRAELAARTLERTRLDERATEAIAAAEKVRISSSAVALLESEQARQAAEAATRVSRRTERAGRIHELEIAATEGAELARLRDSAAGVAAEEGAAVEEARRALVRVDGRLDEAVRRVAESERGRAQRAERIAEATGLEARAEWLSGPFRRSVLGMEQRLLAHAQAIFERNLTRYFAALVDDPSFVARTDVAFTPAVAIDGEWTPAEALSGGERTSLALAFRLALAEVVRTLGHLKLDTILLDEPTDGFSPEQVVRMGELLDALGLPQVVIVSHEEALAGIADRVVRVEKVGGRSVLRTGAGESPAAAAAEGTGPPEALE